MTRPHASHRGTSPLPLCGGFHCYQFNVYNFSLFLMQETFVSWWRVITDNTGSTSFQSMELSSVCLGEMEPVAKEKVSY